LFAAASQQFGKIDILVNNAGITRDNLIIRMSGEDFDRVIDVNLKGTWNCMKLAARIMMKQRSGRIINLSSVVGVAGNAGQTNYAASKAGVIGLTKSLARELAGRGVTVNAVAPGYIETDMTSTLSEEIKAMVQNSIPMRRMGQSSDVASLVAFLAGNDSGYITGQVIHVDGGMVM
jgi:3-oxoacyl-[acyl-carrier protein] reductase